MESDILSQFLPIIQKHYPNVQPQDVRSYKSGYNHHVCVVANTTAFRFPQSREAEEQDMVENTFLCQFADTTPVPIQEMDGHIDAATGMRYQTYTFLHGMPLTASQAKLLPEDTLLSIAKTMGVFLSQLHAFSLDEAKKMGMTSIENPEKYGEYFRDVIAVDKPALVPYLTKEEWIWCEELLQDFYHHTKKHGFPLRVIHGDLICEHILIDEKTHQITGIIDFALQIADPANDFKMFDLYGKDFLNTVYESYALRDEFFEIRRQFHTGDHLMAKTYRAIAEDKSQEEQQKCLKDLKAYIKAQQE